LIINYKLKASFVGLTVRLIANGGASECRPHANESNDLQNVVYGRR
jgi:hypothetical protein